MYWYALIGMIATVVLVIENYDILFYSGSQEFLVAAHGGYYADSLQWMYYVWKSLSFALHAFVGVDGEYYGAVEQ